MAKRTWLTHSLCFQKGAPQQKHTESSGDGGRGGVRTPGAEDRASHAPAAVTLTPLTVHFINENDADSVHMRCGPFLSCKLRAL